MFKQFNDEIKKYQKSWQDLCTNSPDPKFFKGLVPTAVGWKVTNLAEFDRLFLELRERCDQVHLAWINERWLATMHLKVEKMDWDIEVVKLMQRRPGSDDAVGLDHVDFLATDLADVESILSASEGLKWTKETNNPHCSWLSVWFNGNEAKLRDNTVLDVCIAELKEVNQRIVDAN